MAVAFDRLYIGGHHCKGLESPEFPPPQLSYGRPIFSIAGQVKSPQTLDSHDPSLLKQCYGLGNGLYPGHRPRRTPELQLWSTVRTGIGLGMETTVAWIIILPLTGRAHGELGHSGFFSIIGDILGDGETRAAVGTIDEWVEVPSVLGVHKLPETIPTD